MPPGRVEQKGHKEHGVRVLTCDGHYTREKTSIAKTVATILICPEHLLLHPKLYASV